MSWIAIVSALRRAWNYVAGSRIVQAVAAVVALIGWHRWQIASARRQGRDNERREAEQAAHSRRAEVRDEIEAARERAHSEIDRQEKRDEDDPRDRFTRQPFD